MKISIGQALLILLDKYKNNSDEFNQLKKLYLSGAKNQDCFNLIEQYLKDDALSDFEISSEHHIINNDDSRRYFETHLSYLTLKNSIGKLDLKSIQAHREAVTSVVAPYYSQLWMHVTEHHLIIGDNTEREYANFLKKLAHKEIFQDFSDEDREKISHIVALTFIGIVIASNRDSLLPLSIYWEGVYRETGKLAKSAQQTTNTSAYGLLRGHSSLSANDLGVMKQPQTFLKPSDQSTYDLDKPWVQENFAKLVHPFSNSISGTMLCQMRFMLKIRNDLKNDPNADPDSIALVSEKIKNFVKIFISAMLFNSGGHSLYEFMGLFKLDKVQEAFADVEGFNKFDLEELFLTSNQEAFDSALEQTIQYNKRLLIFAAGHEKIKDKKKAFDTESLTNAVKDSSFSQIIKNGFLASIDTDVKNAQTCFRVAQDLKAMMTSNEERIKNEYLASYRSGSARHKILQENLNVIIESLSQGKLDKAKKQIEHTWISLDSYSRSFAFFKTRIPELGLLNKIYLSIDSSVETKTQMKFD